MKKLSKLKLHNLSQQNLEELEMNSLRGGKSCTCSCYWEGKGGSSSGDNSKANYKLGSDERGGYSSDGDNCYIADDDGMGNVYVIPDPNCP